MSWYNDQSWRDSYDSWKLATPPWYDDEPEEGEPEEYDYEDELALAEWETNWWEEDFVLIEEPRDLGVPLDHPVTAAKPAGFFNPDDTTER